MNFPAYAPPSASRLGCFEECTGFGLGYQPERWTPFGDRWA